MSLDQSLPASDFQFIISDVPTDLTDLDKLECSIKNCPFSKRHLRILTFQNKMIPFCKTHYKQFKLFIEKLQAN